MTETVTLEKDDFLIKEGEESAEMYFLKSGTLAVFKRKGVGEQQIGTIYAGEVVGEMSFLDKEPRSASVKALSDCELSTIPSERFDKLFHSFPPWYKALLNTLLDRLRKANVRIKI